MMRRGCRSREAESHSGARSGARIPAVVAKRALDRRTFLRGAGAALALPYLSAMSPALSRQPSRRPMRVLFIFSPNGMKMDEWTPERPGEVASLPYLLEPLEPLRKHLLVLSGLALDGGRAHGDGPGDHARAAASFLTGAHPRKTGGADILAGVSIDQMLAPLLSRGLPFPSVEAGMEEGRFSGSCDSGYSCAYSNAVSWRAPSAPNPKEVRPAALFERLFGPAGGDPHASGRNARRRSILDLLAEDAARLRAEVGASDRERLDGYLESVRSVERRLQEESEGAPPALPESWEPGRRGDYPDRLALQYDILRLALQTDRTRVATFMLGNAGSNRSYRWLGVPEGHHDLSHHGRKERNLQQIRKINRFQVEAFARFGESLARTPAETGTLLDECAVLFGSGIADGDRHNHEDLPILLLGGAGGRLAPGGHIVFKRNTPLANVYLELLRMAGSDAESFADSSGRCPEIRE